MAVLGVANETASIDADALIEEESVVTDADALSVAEDLTVGALSLRDTLS